MLTDALGARVDVTGEAHLRVDAPNSPALVLALARTLADNDVTLVSLDGGHARLEDVYLRLTSDRDGT
jgi:hypothetical protein